MYTQQYIRVYMCVGWEHINMSRKDQVDPLLLLTLARQFHNFRLPARKTTVRRVPAPLSAVAGRTITTGRGYDFCRHDSVPILRLAIAVVALGGVKDRMTGVREEEGGEEGEERDERIVLCQTPILFVIFRLRHVGATSALHL